MNITSKAHNKSRFLLGMFLLSLYISAELSLAELSVWSAVWAQQPSPSSLSSQSAAVPNSNLSLSFDEKRAFKILSELVQRGQRYYGAPMRNEVIQGLAKQLQDLGAEISLQAFEKVEPKSQLKYTLTNIVARFNPQAKQRVILGSHWDTRLWAEEDHNPNLKSKPITGANDGSSGVAVLLELARQLDKLKLKDLGVDIVLFDGEEFGRPGSDDYCAGSRYFAQNLSTYYPSVKPKAVIVIDMVGDKDLAFPPEQSSVKFARPLTTLIWREAIKLKLPAFQRGLERGSPHAKSLWIVDDHSPFQKLGIPAVLVIDLNYPHWHTHQDTMDKISPQSLKQTGLALLASLKTLNTIP